MKIKRKPVLSNLKDLHAEIGDLIRRQRQGYGLTQTDLGKMVGLSRSSINGIEAGDQQMLLSDAIVIGELLNISLDCFGLKFKSKETQKWLKKRA